MSDYSEKLKDPRWQKKRLIILKRDKCTCQYCGENNKMLVVRHKDYFPDTEPWDYPNDYLITLCEDCHDLERMGRLDLETAMTKILRKHFRIDNLFILLDGFESLEPQKEVDLYLLSEVIRWICSDDDIRKELLDRCWNIMHGDNDAQRR